MDPLSLVASVIALVQAAAAISKGINTLRSMGKAPAELCALLNELTTLQSLSNQLQEDHPPTNSSSVNAVARCVADIKEIVKDMEDLVNRFLTSSKGLNRNGQHRISAARWRLERDNVLTLRDRARQARETLAVCFASKAAAAAAAVGTTTTTTTTTASPGQLVLEVERVFRVSAGELGSSIRAENNESLQRIDESLCHLRDTQMQTMNSLAALTTSISSIQHSPTPTAADPNPSQSTSVITSSPSPKSPDAIACVQAFRRTPCTSSCKCQCHRTELVRSPEYLQRAVGALVLAYNALPLFKARPCDYHTCRSRSRSTFKLYYHLPSWILSRALLFTLSWDSLTGQGASLYLKIPRVISSHDSIWKAIRCCDTQRLLERFASKINTPTDISPSGTSLLLHSMSTGQPVMMGILLHAGCDITFKNYHGISPANKARGRLYISDLEPISERMHRLYQAIVHMDDENSYNSTLIHDTLLHRHYQTGPSAATTATSSPLLTLQDAVRLEPAASLDALDGLGYSPLHWAARRQDKASLEILLEAGARVDTRNLNGRTALHFSAQRGHLDVVKRLLAAGSDVGASDVNGRTPLHLAVAASAETSTETMAVLLGAAGGCDVDARDRVNWFTPLNNLVYESLARDPWDCHGKINALLNAGADIDAPDKWGCTPLLNAAMIPWDNTLFRILYERGAKTQVRDGTGRGILHYAAAYGDLEHLEYLRSLGLTQEQVDTYSRDQTGHTPSSLMEWRAGTNPKKLWTNMKRATKEEVSAFNNLIREVRLGDDTGDVFVDACESFG